MTDDQHLITDHQGRTVRLTVERREHILQHPEMSGQFERVLETLQSLETVITTLVDATVHVYHRYYEITPVTSKFLLVVVKILETDAFVLTAFFSRREKKGNIVWKA